MRDYRKFELWKRSVVLARDIYLLTGKFPASERYGLSSQLQRAAISIASNIAEGSARNSESDFARYLEIAIGSSFEVETQLIIAKEIGYITNETLEAQLVEIRILQKQTNQFIQRLRKAVGR